MKQQLKCSGCGRKEMHKSYPAYGTPYYMSGKLFTPELEKEYKNIKDSFSPKITKQTLEDITGLS